METMLAPGGISLVVTGQLVAAIIVIHRAAI